MKAKHEQYHPKIVKYRDYKNCDTKLFKNRLELTQKYYIFLRNIYESFK